MAVEENITPVTHSLGDRVKNLSRPLKIIMGILGFDMLLLILIGLIYSNGVTIAIKNAQIKDAHKELEMTTLTASPTAQQLLLSGTPSPTIMPKKPPATVPTNTPTQSQNNNSTVIYLTPTPSPTPMGIDTTPPQILEVMDLDEGGTYAYSSTCIPVRAHDDGTPFAGLVFRFKLDSSDWTNWGSDEEYCTQNLSEGSHALSVEVKDQAGNVGSLTRNFTIKRS